MRRFFMALMLGLISIASINAETKYGYTTNCLVLNRYTNQWEPISGGYGIDVVLTENGFFVNSDSKQAFRCFNVSNSYINQSGHLQYTANAIDQDGVRCGIRVVFRNDIEAPYQIYIHYNNIDYVYNIVITRTTQETYYI